MHENEAASEILHERLQPELDDIVRRAELGLVGAARRKAGGLLRGISSCQDNVRDGTVLSFAGPDVTNDLTWSVRPTVAKLGLAVPGAADETPAGGHRGR